MTDDKSLDDYDRIEQEVGEWAEENFGADQPAWYPLVGAAEEIGEIAGNYQITKDGRMSLLLQLLEDVGLLCHAILKDTQGIREDDKWVGERAEQRAMSRIHHSLSWLGEMDSVGSAELPEGAEYEEVADGVGDLHVYMADFGHRNPVPLSLGECVDYAWYDEVADREWDADVEVGDAE